MRPVPSAPAVPLSSRPLARLACLLALSTMPMLLQAAPAALEREVNTFIGSKDDGNTFPGASAPFGLIQVSPIGSHYSGWRYDDEKIRGFGHSFISGAGCWEQGGQVSILPVTGSIGPGGDFDTADAKNFNHKTYAASYTHDGEIGQAGYYKVRLTSYGGIDAEATARTPPGSASSSTARSRRMAPGARAVACRARATAWKASRSRTVPGSASTWPRASR